MLLLNSLVGILLFTSPVNQSLNENYTFYEVFGQGKLTLRADSSYSYYGGFNCLINDFKDEGVWKIEEDTLKLFVLNSFLELKESKFDSSNSVQLIFECEKKLLLSNYMLFVRKKNGESDYYYLEKDGLKIDELQEIASLSIEDKNRNILQIDPHVEGNLISLNFSIDSIRPHPQLKFTTNKSRSRIKRVGTNTMFNRE